MGFRACVWDLDGTLLYTLPTIHHYCNRSFVISAFTALHSTNAVTCAAFLSRSFTISC